MTFDVKPAAVSAALVACSSPGEPAHCPSNAPIEESIQMAVNRDPGLPSAVTHTQYNEDA
jgi:hypothetical protein